VRWVGRSTVSRRFADPLRILPIRVKACALGENLPNRDLLVSPNDALYIDGVPTHAGALVNGTSIVRESNIPIMFTYYHVETDDHSLIFRGKYTSRDVHRALTCCCRQLDVGGRWRTLKVARLPPRFGIVP
jgi:hypothetical protein